MTPSLFLETISTGTFFENIQIGSDSSLPLEVCEQPKDDILLEFENQD